MNGAPDPYATQKQQIISQIIKEAQAPTPAPPQFEQYYTPQQMQVDQNELRRGQALGGLLQATGDRGLSAMGQTFIPSTDPVGYRQDAARQEQVRRYQQWQADQPPNRTGPLSRALSAMGSSEPDGYKPRFKPTSSERGSAAELRSILDAGNNLYRSFDPEYGQIKAMGYGVPRGRSISNWLAGEGFGSEEAKKAQRWWSNWDRLYTLPIRNETFGATLTPSEQQAWKAANINENMDESQIRNNLKIILSILEKKMDTNAQLFQESELYGTNWYDSVFGGIEMPFDASSVEFNQGNNPQGSQPSERTQNSAGGIRRKTRASRETVKVTPDMF